MSNTPRSLILCAAVLLATLCSGARAQSPAAAPVMGPGAAGEFGPAMGPAAAGVFGPVAAAPPGPDCMDALLNMTACLTYVEEGSNLTVPDKGCCPGMSQLVNSQPVCLCQLLASGDVYGVKIEKARALALPTACHVQTPDVSLCSLLGVPVSSPMGPSMSPTSGISQSPESPIGASPSAGSGTPTSSPSSSERITPTILILFIGLICSIAIL